MISPLALDSLPIEYGIILLGYVTLLVELTCFHVPSVASGVNILRKDEAVVETYSAKFRSVFQRSLQSRILITFVPLIPVYGVFIYPILVMTGVIPYPVNSLNWSIWLGCLLVIMGRVITFGSVLMIRRQNQQKQDSFRLHTDFLFARSRNPGLLGMYVFVLGIWAVMPSLLLLAGILYYIAYMHVKVLMEEDFLTQKFGEPYLHYKTSTGRYWS